MYRQVEKFQLRTVRGIVCVDAFANSKDIIICLAHQLICMERLLII